METKAFNEQSLLLENVELRARLEEAEELLRAIRAGEVDAIMVEADAGPRLFTLQGLDAQQNRFRGDLLAQVSDAVIAVDLEDRVTFLNGAAELQYRVKASDMLGRKLDEIVSRHWPTPAEEAASRAALRDFGTWRGEELQRTQDGRELAVESTLSKLHAPDGSCIGMVAAIRDITERLRINHELHEKTAFLQRIAEITPGVLQVFDLAERRAVFINRSVGTLLGFAPDAVQAMGSDVVSTLMHADDIPQFELHLDRVRALSDGEVAHFEHRMRDQAGEWRWFHSCDAVFARSDSGAVRQLIGVATEITDRKRAETVLREREHFLERIFDVIPGVLKIVDMKDSRCVFVNQNVDSVLGYSPDEIVHMGGDIVKILMHLDDQAYYHQHFVRLSTFEPGTIAKFEYRMRHKDGEWRWLETRDTVFLRDDNGVAKQYIGLSSDITERKKAEEELRRLAAELSTADQRKDEFLAMLAHELRNPLAPLRNGLQILRLSSDDKETVEEISLMMERQLAQMVHLVDDLLDVSRISRGKLELRKQRIELSSIVNNAVETSRPLIDACGHELTIVMPPEPIWIDADPTRLGQVFSNILNNAAKYSEPDGRIELVARVEWRVESEKQVASDEGASEKTENAESEVLKLATNHSPLTTSLATHDSPLGTPFVVVSIKDTGVGIPSNMLPKIFEMFTQVDRSLEKAQGGLGLGLSLVKRFVDMHGGSVVAHSEGHGRGSTFVVQLPIASSVAQVNKLPIGQDQTSSAGKRRILVADDNRDAATTLALILKIMGNEVRTANDGLQAVEMATVFQPDVIMLDIGMPKLNGYEACRRIREQPWGKKVTLIALTCLGQDDDRRRSKEAGFDHHLVKPVDHAVLRKLLSAEPIAG